MLSRYLTNFSTIIVSSVLQPTLEYSIRTNDPLCAGLGPFRFTFGIFGEEFLARTPAIPSN